MLLLPFSKNHLIPLKAVPPLGFPAKLVNVSHSFAVKVFFGEKNKKAGSSPNKISDSSCSLKQ